MMKKIVIISDKEHSYTKLQTQLLEIGYLPKQIIWQTNTPSTSKKIKNAIVLVEAISFNNNKSIDIFKKLQVGFLNSMYILLVAEENKFVTKAITAGATDYLLKSDCSNRLLAKTIACAIERQKNFWNNESQTEYKGFFYDSPVAMWIYDIKTLKFLSVNNAAIQRYGYSREEFLNLTIEDIRPSADNDLLNQALETKKPNGYFDSGRWRHIKKNGEIFYVHIYSHAITYKSRAARLVIAEDVNKKVFTERKNRVLRSALQQQKKRYSDILASLTEVVWSMEADNYRLLFINDACKKIFGYTANEMMTDKKIFFNCVHPEDLAKVIDGIEKTKATGATTVAFRIRHKDGSIRHLTGTSVYQKSENEPDTITGLTIDITEQEHLKEKIFNEQQQLSAIINNTKDVIWSIDTDANIVTANQAFYERVAMITGKKEFSAITETDFEADIFKQWQTLFERAFKENMFKVVIENVINGKTVYEEISFNQIHDKHGNLTGVSCFSRDITESKKLQLKIQQDKQNLRALIDNTDDLIWSVDTEIRIISANQAYISFIEKFIGITPDTGQNVLWTQLGDEVYNKRKLQYEQALSGIRFTEQEEWFFKNEVVCNEISFNPIHDIDGNVIGVSCFSRDISEHKKQLEKIQLQNDKLKEIAWIQSHKVRGPVASILGLAQLFNKQNIADPENETIINGLIESTNMLDEIIREVVDKTYDIESE